MRGLKKLVNNFKEYYSNNKERCLTILTIIILSILSSIILISYSFYQNKSSKLIISGVALIDSSDVSIKVYRENKNDSGVGLGTYALSYYVPSSSSYSYVESKTVCDTGITIEKYENQKFYVDATKKGKCKVYFDAIDGYIDDYEVNLFVQQEESNTDDKNYNQMGQLPLYETGYYYTINESKTSCTNGATVSIVGRKIIVLTTQKAVCNVYADKNGDSESPTIGNDLKVDNDTLTVTLNDNAMLGSYGLSNSSEIEPEEWIEIPTTPYSLSTPITSDTPYLWLKDAAGNITKSSEIEFLFQAMLLILNNNGGKDTIEAKGTPDFSKVATTNEGMYAANDDYTATTGMKSYYFRGAVNNNWVKFGKENNKDMYWRIIRINGDGSIRMIYSGTTKPESSTATVMTGTGTQINATTYSFNSSYDRSEYVGYQYINGKQHGYGECNGTSASCTVNGNTVYNSTIKQAIDKWYAGTTLEKDAATKALVSQDQIFCNDRSASSIQTAAWKSTGAAYYYGADGRLFSNKTPILTCPTASDKFTVGTSNGNGALTYPVGLITADEVAMAGGKLGTTNSSYYLYTNQYYWSGSPDYFFNRNGSTAPAGTRGFSVYSSGDFAAGIVINSFGARPVISLSSKAKLSGSGTYNNVYTVK